MVPTSTQRSIPRASLLRIIEPILYGLRISCASTVVRGKYAPSRRVADLRSVSVLKPEVLPYRVLQGVRSPYDRRTVSSTGEKLHEPVRASLCVRCTGNIALNERKQFFSGNRSGRKRDPAESGGGTRAADFD